MLIHELETYLHEHIPLSKAMAVSVREVAPDHVLLCAPLQPNINHRATVFGGSASALAILSAWSLLHARTRDAGIDARLVIQRNEIDYLRPMLGEFTARATLGDAEQWHRFVALLAKRGKARIRVSSLLECGNEVAGQFIGEFVALAH